MTRSDRQERRRQRRQQVTQERVALQEERQAAWGRRTGRRVFRWRGRRSDAVEVKFDFRAAVVIEFNYQCDSVEDVFGMVALKQVLFRKSDDDPPN